MATTIVISVALFTALALIVRKMYRDKKTGRTCCGDCAHCQACDARYSIKMAPRHKDTAN
ncbi:MAG: FeoB-associated Cys-rich membrane protein [Synergistaceae bacterium]|nr:FeoB-associated Cys-rich membrane protein [Synergistaceae bacterium]